MSIVRITVRQATRAAKSGLSAPPAGKYEAVRRAGSRTVRYRNVATGEVVSRRCIDNARNAASYEAHARRRAASGVESPIKRYYRAVRRARLHDPNLTLEQARRRVSRRRTDGYRHFVSSYMQRHGVSRGKAEHEVRRALAVLDQKPSTQSDLDRTAALRAIGRIGEDEFYQDATLVTTGFEAG
jgi:hypothetical protein